MVGKRREVIVVGGGLAGLATAMRLCEQGFGVKIVSVTQVKRSHSVCAQGGINAAVNTKGENDSPLIHAFDTIHAGDFLGDQPPILEMCLTAPKILEMMDRFGCTFNRTADGSLDFRRFGGTLYQRTAFCGSSTGQQLLYSLDEQVRRYEAKKQVEKFEHHEFLRLVRDENGVARGIVMMDLHKLELTHLKGDAVVIATGGSGVIFKRSTNSTICTGAANGRLYMQGMTYANGEFIQIHPTAIPGLDKLRLMSESIRGEGGRLWVYGDRSKRIEHSGQHVPCGKTGEPWYFLEELYPKYGNLVARDVAVREMMHIMELGLGVDGRNEVYLDVTHLPEKTIQKLASVLKIYQKFTGEDPKKVPMRVAPAVHYSMGGAWVDWPGAEAADRMERYRQMTNIEGCFVAGEADYQYHGANRLGANSLLSCIFGGLVAGLEVGRYVESVKTHQNEQAFQRAVELEERFKHDLFARRGKENIHALHEELSSFLVKHVTVKRSNQGLTETMNKIKEIRERYQNIQLDDSGLRLNQTYIFANQFRSMLELALVMTKGALLRNESRGSHYKVEFPDRNDAEWLKTTMATYDCDEPKISYRAVDMPYLQPIERDYKEEKGYRELSNLPEKLELPLWDCSRKSLFADFVAVFEKNRKS